MSDELQRLAELLRGRDAIDAEIAKLTGRSARPGDIGEHIAASIFDIELARSPTQAGLDGIFRSGPLGGKTVNIKAYRDVSDGLAISPHACDVSLVLSGPRRTAGGVRHYRWRIVGVYLFQMPQLLATLRHRGVKIDPTATSLQRADIEAAQIFPTSRNAELRPTPEQVTLLQLFA